MCQALFIVLLLGWLFVPVYLTAGVSISVCMIIVHCKHQEVYLSLM